MHNALFWHFKSRRPFSKSGAILMLMIGSPVLFELAAHRVSASPISVSPVAKQHQSASDWSPKHTGAIWRTSKHPAPLLSLCPHWRRPNVPGSAAMHHSTPRSYFQCSQPQLETFLILFFLLLVFVWLFFGGCQVDWSRSRVHRGGTSSDPHPAFLSRCFVIIWNLCDLRVKRFTDFMATVVALK